MEGILAKSVPQKIHFFFEQIFRFLFPTFRNLRDMEETQTCVRFENLPGDSHHANFGVSQKHTLVKDLEREEGNF